MKLTETQIAYLVLSFHDGTLSAAEKEILDAYIVLNPQLAEELNESPKLSDSLEEVYNGPNLSYPALESLEVYPSEKGHPFDKIAIGSLEGLLSKKEQHLEKQLRLNPFYKAHKTSIAKTQLIADLQILFPNHELLYKSLILKPNYFKKYVYALSAVAALLVLILLMNFNRTPVQNTNLTNKPLTAKLNGLSKKSSTSKTQINSVNVSAENLQIQVDKSMALIHVEAQKKILNMDPIELVAQLPKNEFSIHENANPSNSEILTQENNISPKMLHAMNPISKSSEPITVKTFFIKKANQRLFGTPQPSTDVRYQTMARYANQTMGIDVKYDVEPGQNADKIFFQLGPLSIERSRSKK